MIARRAASIAVVSDVSAGYGSPQVLLLARSLSELFAAAATVYEPDQSHRPPQDMHENFVALHRVVTDVTPYGLTGRIQYVTQVARQLNESRPDVVVILNTYCLPVLAKLHYRPRQTLYVLSEMAAPYGRLAVATNRELASRIDLIVFPEANRARLDVARCGFTGIPTAVLYNCSQPAPNAPTELTARQPRLFYGGAISTATGVAQRLTHKSLRELPFDVFGEVTGPDGAAILRRFAHRENLLYHGCVDAETLATARRTSAFSIVTYRPTNESTRFAAPNKFFEAIADGVPPIATPHPQCCEIVERYRCGLIARNWSFAAYRDVLHRAMDYFGGPRYARLVENCRRAAREELNWNRQFEKLKPLLSSAA